MSRVLPYNAKQWEIPAILDGRKTVTRQVIKPQPDWFDCGIRGDRQTPMRACDVSTPDQMIKQPYQPGDILYVRETFCIGEIAYGEEPDGRDVPYVSQCKGENQYISYEYCIRNDIGIEDVKWKPSIHMPKDAARIWLKVTGVRVERLQDICKDWSQFDEEGIIEEHGFRSEMHQQYQALWDSTVDKEEHKWISNPWVWAIEFEQCEKPEERV